MIRMTVEERLKQLAMRRGPEITRVNLYERDMLRSAEDDSYASAKVDISDGGRFYVSFRTASGTQMAALESAAGRGKIINEIDSTGRARQILEFHDWDIVECAIRLGLIVDACLPALDDDGSLTEFVIEKGDDPAKVLSKINEGGGKLIPVLAMMIRDRYFGDEEGDIALSTKVVEEAGNCLNACSQ